MSKENEQQGRWKGRNEAKDALRASVWGNLEKTGAAIGSPYSHIPHFVGADQAADRLADLPIWRQARVVKCNPDKPQIPVRLRALQEGKILYAPVPELAKDYPFLELDPDVLKHKGVDFKDAAPIQGALQYGRRVRFDEMKPFDIAVVGCVAVTRAGGRTGKGGGFADLELGCFRDFNLIDNKTPIVTTVHSLQVVADEQITMVGHDTPLDWIITPDEVIETHTQYPHPGGVVWDSVQEDQMRDIPFLKGLKERFTK